MLLRMLVPFLETFAEEGSVVRWHVQEGESVEFGDPLCDIALSQWMALRKTKRAVNLVKIAGKSPGDVRHNLEKREGRGVVIVRVVASEPGYVRAIRAFEGNSVRVGDLLALVTTESADPLDDFS